MSYMNLNSYNNDWFNPGNNIKILFWLLISALFFRTSLPFPSFVKVFFLKMFGAKIGHNVVIKPNVNVKFPWNLIIGDYTWVGEDVWIDNLALVKIGSNCCLSQGCYLLTGNHDYTSISFDLIISDIIIENECWVGAKSIVCPGVILNLGSILTAGSVATKNLEQLSIYQGNPAKKTRKRVIL